MFMFIYIRKDTPLLSQYMNAENTYPHHFEDIVLIVPNIMTEKSNLIEIFMNSPLINVWTIIIIMVTVVRILLMKFTKHAIVEWTTILLHTYGLSFGVYFPVSIQNRAEKVLILFLGIFAILANIFCSGFLFQQYTIAFQTPTIDSLEDLNKSNLNVYVSNYLYSKSDNNFNWLKTQYNSLCY